MLLVEEDFLRDTYQAAAHAIQTKSDSVPDLASLVAAKVSVYVHVQQPAGELCNSKILGFIDRD